MKRPAKRAKEAIPVVTQIYSKAAFEAVFDVQVHRSPWNLDALNNNAPLKRGVEVSGKNGPYRVNGGRLLINLDDGLPGVDFRFCSSNDMAVNFALNDALLVVGDNNGVAEPTAAPLQFTFENPVQAVGAYVGLKADQASPIDAMKASLWIQVDGSSTWVSVAQNGHCGMPMPAGSTPGAPFVAARSEAGPIKRVAFDVSSMSRFNMICLGNLLWVP